MKGPEPIGGFGRGRDGRWAKSSRIWIPEIGAEHRIRVDRVKQELAIEERARTDAQKLQPDHKDVVLNEPQLDICNRVFAGILMLNQFLAEQLGTALGIARKAAANELDRDFYVERVEIEADTIFSEYRGDVRQLRQNQIERALDLRYFKSANRLKRGAAYKESGLLVGGIILGLLILESFANGMLFRDIVSGGWVDGIFLAFVISTVNIFLGVAAGLGGWKNVGHVKLIRRIGGCLAVAILHGVALFWNLGVAHFRQVAETAARREDYDFDVMALADSMRDHIAMQGWFGFESLIAWALLLIGLGVHVVATYEGWSAIGDSYPHYMKMDKRAKQAQIHYDQGLVDMRADARQAAEGVIAEAEQEADQTRQAAAIIADLENLAIQREQEVRDSEDQWVAGGTQLLRTYRDINLEVRGEAPAPGYFDSFPTADDYRQGDFGAGLARRGDVDAHVTAARAAITELGSLKASCEAIVSKNNHTISELRGEVNRVLTDLSARMESADEKATAEAKTNLDEVGS